LLGHPPPALLALDDPLISTYFSNKVGKAYVKIDAESVCNIAQSRVKLTVELYKIGKLGGNWFRAQQRILKAQNLLDYSSKITTLLLPA
jgi:hypothetical protein